MFENNKVFLLIFEENTKNLGSYTIDDENQTVIQIPIVLSKNEQFSYNIDKTYDLIIKTPLQEISAEEIDKLISNLCENNNECSQKRCIVASMMKLAISKKIDNYEIVEELKIGNNTHKKSTR